MTLPDTTEKFLATIPAMKTSEILILLADTTNKLYKMTFEIHRGCTSAWSKISNVAHHMLYHELDLRIPPRTS